MVVDLCSDLVDSTQYHSYQTEQQQQEQQSCHSFLTHQYYPNHSHIHHKNYKYDFNCTENLFCRLCLSQLSQGCANLELGNKSVITSVNSNNGSSSSSNSSNLSLNQSCIMVGNQFAQTQLLSNQYFNNEHVCNLNSKNSSTLVDLNLSKQSDEFDSNSNLREFNLVKNESNFSKLNIF